MPIPLRGDFQASEFGMAARRSKDAAQARRLRALAAVYDGANRSEAAKIGGGTLQIIRDWVVRFNAHGPDGLIDRKALGQPSRLNATHRAAFAKIIESGSIPAVHGVVRWRIVDCQIAWKHDPHFAPNRDPLRLKFERFQILRAVGLRAVGKWPAGASAESLAQAGHLSMASGPQVGRDGLGSSVSASLPLRPAAFSRSS